MKISAEQKKYLRMRANQDQLLQELAPRFDDLVRISNGQYVPADAQALFVKLAACVALEIGLREVEEKTVASTSGREDGPEGSQLVSA